MSLLSVILRSSAFQVPAELTPATGRFGSHRASQIAITTVIGQLQNK
jgi:hypothetical protein